MSIFYTIDHMKYDDLLYVNISYVISYQILTFVSIFTEPTFYFWNSGRFTETSNPVK